MISRSRILIADDHNLIAELFQQLLAVDFDVVGVVGDGHALVRAAVELKPDLILVDIGMPLLNGLDAGRKVKKLLPMVKLVYVTLSSAARRCRGSVRAWSLRLLAQDMCSVGDDAGDS